MKSIKKTKGRPSTRLDSDKKFTLPIPDDLHQQITEEARTNHRTITGQILFILEKFFKGEK